MAIVEFSSIADTQLVVDNPNTNYGNIDTMTCISESYPQYTRRCLIKFDLSELIKVNIINSAILQLYVTGAFDSAVVCPIGVYRVTSQWEELAATWNIQPNIDTTLIASTNVSGPGIYQWNITSLVEKWRNMEYPYYGIELRNNGPVAGSDKTFATRENSNTSYRPKLTITATIVEDIQFLLSPYPYILLPYLDVKGHLGVQLDFSQIVAGQSVIKEIKLKNDNTCSIKDVIVFLENIPAGDTVEISKFNNPFISSPEVHFDGTFASGSDVGTFYVRVKPSENSSGSKSFRIKAKATPV